MVYADFLQFFYSIHDGKSNDIDILTCKSKRILITLQIKYKKKLFVMILQQHCKRFKYKISSFTITMKNKKNSRIAQILIREYLYFFQFYQIDNSFKTLTSSLSIGLSFLIALANGTYTILSFSIPIITFL